MVRIIGDRRWQSIIFINKGIKKFIRGEGEIHAIELQK